MCRTFVFIIIKCENVMQTQKRKTKTKFVMSKRKLSASLEDYLESIYRCIQERGVARVSYIANELGVGQSSVTAALKILAEKHYVNYDPYQCITLTESGEALASQITRKHRILKKFLVEILGISENQANINACKMEHVMDDDVLDRMLCFIQYLNNSKRNKKSFPELLDDFCSHNKDNQQC